MFVFQKSSSPVTKEMIEDFKTAKILIEKLTLQLKVNIDFDFIY